MRLITMKKFVGLVVGVALLVVLTTGCSALGTTIEPGEIGLKYLILSEPGLQEKPYSEGFYFQWGWNEMIAYDTTWQSRNERVAVLSADNLHVPIVATVTFRAKPDAIYKLHLTIGPSYYEDVVQPEFVTLVRSEFAKYEHNDLARLSPEIENAVLESLRKILGSKPIDIDHVSIKHIEYDRAVTASISSKLVKQQEAKQRLFEVEIAERDADIARAQARGTGDAIRIQAEGEAEAIKIKGKAQAAAQADIAKTLTKSYLQYKAFDGDATTYYFVPVGKDGMPIIVNAESTRR